MKKYLIPLCLFAMTAASCAHGNDSETAPAEYSTVTVSTSDQTLKVKYSSSLEGLQLVEVRPQVGGVITGIRFNEGDRVHKGQILFVIDQVPYKAAVEAAKADVASAEAAVATARLTADSNQKLYDKGVISEFELQTAKNSLAQAEAQLGQAEAQLVTARNNLSYTEVRCPVNGSAGMIPYRVGSLVSSSISTPLVTVSDDNVIYAYFSMSENKVLELVRKYGSTEKMISDMPPVSLVLSDGEEYPLEGRLDAVSGIVDSGTGAVRMRARFDNPNHVLRSGGSGSVVIPTYFKDVIVIPQTATYEIQEKTFAYKVVDGKAKNVELKVSKANDGVSYIVESGLKSGDIIIAEGAGLVKDGTPVKVKEEAPEASATNAESKSEEGER